MPNCQHQEVFNSFNVGSVFMLITAGFTLKNEGFTLEHGDASTNEPHARFLHNVPHCINT
jgi:hypothetical protein